MTKSKTSVRELRPADIPSFVELTMTRDNFDRAAAERRAAVVEHIAFKNPTSDGGPTYLVGVQDDRIVGHLGRMPTSFAIDGERLSGCYFHDLYVHPDVRAQGGQGFFLTMNLYRAAENAAPGFCAMIWTNEINISIQQARNYDQLWTLRYAKRTGLDHLIDRYLLPQIGRLAKPVTRKLLGVADSCRALFDRTGVIVERVDFFDARFDELAKRLATSGKIAPYKSSKYLNWKYISRPDLSAIPYAAIGEDGTILGYTVVVDLYEHFRAAVIAEIVALDDDAAVTGCLLDQAIEHARRGLSQRLSAVTTNVAVASVLKARQFRAQATKEPLFLAFAERSGHPVRLSSPENWNMVLGDSEGPF